MHIEIIAIGDELVEGHRVDTNSAWLGRQARGLGLRVAYHTTVGDQMCDLTTVLRTAFARSDIVLCTGGLGPTADDLTRDALAVVTGRELETRAEELDHIEHLFAARGRVMPPRNAVQARFPAGSAVIPNTHGTAPGIHVQVQRGTDRSVHLFALPGVPAEMRAMWTETVRPLLDAMRGSDRTVVCQRLIHCFGIGESEVERRLPDLIQRGRQPSVGITAHEATITLRIVAEGRTEQQCAAAMDPIVETIHACLGDVVFGAGEDQLQDAVTRLLARNHLTLATCEWGTGGLLGSWLAGSSESVATYRGGVLVTDRGGLERVAGRAETTAGSLADRVARAAAAVRPLLQADLGLAVGPFPAQVSTARAPEVVHMALATTSDIIGSAPRFGGHPDILKPRFAKQALNLVRQHLLDPGPR